MKTRRFSLIVGCFVTLAFASPLGAAETKPTTVDELLAKVRGGWKKDTAEAQTREHAFLAAKENQQALLEEARARSTKKRPGSWRSRCIWPWEIWGSSLV